jgi:hypothetical protein
VIDKFKVEGSFMQQRWQQFLTMSERESVTFGNVILLPDKQTPNKYTKQSPLNLALLILQIQPCDKLQFSI